MPERGPCADCEEAPYRREEAPVPPRGGPCAERGPSVPEGTSVLRGLEEALCREEAPVPRGGPLCW